jgi:hypothetical protein
MGLLGNLLSNSLQSSHQYTLPSDLAWDDEQGLVDGSGNPVPKPSFWTKAFNPNAASTYNDTVNQFAKNAALAQQNQNINQKLYGNLVDQIPMNKIPGYTGPSTFNPDNPEEDTNYTSAKKALVASMIKPDLAYSNLQHQGQAVSDMDSGIIPATTRANINTQNAIGSSMGNKNTYETAYQLAGGPGQEAMNTVNQGVLTGRGLNLDSTLFPEREQVIRNNLTNDRFKTGQVDPYNLGREATMAKAGYQAAPDDANSMVTRSALGSLVNQQNLDLSPYSLGANRVNTLRESAMSPYGGQANSGSMYTPYTDLMTGATTMQRNPFSNMGAMAGGQTHTPVPGLPGAFAPVSGAMPVTVGNPSDERGGYGSNQGVNGLNQSSQRNLYKVDGLHSTDPSGQIYYNQGTPQRPQWLPIQTASADLQQKAIDAINSANDRATSQKNLRDKLEKLQGDHRKNVIGVIGEDAIDKIRNAHLPFGPSMSEGIENVRGIKDLIGQGYDYLTQ